MISWVRIHSRPGHGMDDGPLISGRLPYYEPSCHENQARKHQQPNLPIESATHQLSYSLIRLARFARIRRVSGIFYLLSSSATIDIELKARIYSKKQL